MPDKVDIKNLSAVPYTLLIPLVARARGGEFFGSKHLRDPTAEEILKRLGVSGNEFMHEGTAHAIEARTRVIVDLAQSFFQRYPSGLGVNIGCGLSNYFQWLDNGTNHFLDADLPEVIRIRSDLIEPRNERHRFREISLTSTDWWEKLESNPGEPVLVVIEGVSMYLTPTQMHQILRTFGEKAPKGSELVFDFMSWLSIGRARSHSPAMKQTHAEFRWGARRIEEITSQHERLYLMSLHRLLKEHGKLRSVIDFMFEKLTSVPFYGMAQLGVK